MPGEPDPRVYFAAERTLLAWLRTGVTMIGLGFLVARFGLFLRLIRQASPEHSALADSSLLGAGLVAFGAVTILLAAWQHVQFCRTLPAEQRPVNYWMKMAVCVACAVACLGLLLAVGLLVSAS